MKKRKGFTAVELVVTLGILGIAFALSAGLIVAMTTVQKSNATETNKSKEFTRFNDAVSSYVSFLSINTDDISFTYDSEKSADNKIVFDYLTYRFDLYFYNSTLSMTNNYNGDNDYFKKTFSYSFQYIHEVTFEYTPSIGQLVSRVNIGGNVINYSHIVRTVRTAL